RHAEGLRDRRIAVGQQREAEALRRAELLVRLRRIAAHSDDNTARRRDLRVVVAEHARFLGAHPRIVLRIEVQDDRLLAAEIPEREPPALARETSEVGSPLSNLNHAAPPARLLG